MIYLQQENWKRRYEWNQQAEFFKWKFLSTKSEKVSTTNFYDLTHIIADFLQQKLLNLT